MDGGTFKEVSFWLLFSVPIITSKIHICLGNELKAKIFHINISLEKAILEGSTKIYVSFQ